MRSFVRVDYGIAKKLGANSALLLALFINRQEHYSGKDRDSLNIDGKPFIYTTASYVEDLIGLTSHEQRAARKKLIDAKILEEKRAGVLGKLHYHVNISAIDDFSPAKQQTTPKGYDEVEFGVISRKAKAVKRTDEILNNSTSRCEENEHQEVKNINIKKLKFLTSHIYNEELKSINNNINRDIDYSINNIVEKSQHGNVSINNFLNSDLDFKEWYSLWNNICTCFDEVKKPTKDIDRNIKALLDKKYTLNKFKEACLKVNSSSFLRGKDWASMYWVTKPENFKKILSGQYNDERKLNLNGWVPLPDEKNSDGVKL